MRKEFLNGVQMGLRLGFIYALRNGDRKTMKDLQDHHDSNISEAKLDMAKMRDFDGIKQLIRMINRSRVNQLKKGV